MAKFQTKRLTVTVSDDIDTQFLDNTPLADVIEMLQDLQHKHGDNALFQIDMSNDYGYDSPCIESRVYSTHLETDEEYEARRARHIQHEQNKKDAAKANRLAREEKDKRDYARLKTKFAKDEKKLAKLKEKIEEPTQERFATDRRV